MRTKTHISAEVAEDMVAFGLEDEIAGVEVRTEDEDAGQAEPFEVWQENWTTVDVFRSLSTQWQQVSVSIPVAGGLGGFSTRVVRTGIHYPAIPTILSMRRDIKKKDWPEIFQNIRVMERAALQEMRRQEEREST